MSNPLIALIAEDETDYKTVRKIIHRVLGSTVKTKKWAPGGCGLLKKKLAAKLKVMSNEGCDVFIVLHDLDRNPQNNCLNDEAKLRESLEAEFSQVRRLKKHICIPVEELEAWFWSDPVVVQHVGRGKGEAHSNPHLIAKPKERLISLSSGENRKPRYSTNMNPELAEMLNFELCSSRCPSFKELLGFLQSLQGDD